MAWEHALRQRLLDDAGCAALLGTWSGKPCVFWRQRPEGSGLDAIVLTKVSDPRPQTLKGFQDRRQSRVQVDCWAASRDRAAMLSEAAIEALAGPFVALGVHFGRSEISPVRDLGETTDTGFVHRDSFDVQVFHD